MEIILTHEQADFDALGASLGAFLMNEKAYPVLPRRLNRNVRAFLTLYGAELPFVEARDLPAGPVHTVTLVDTQSLITLKGMSRQTAVHVVDHHQMRPELPKGWNITIDHVGACTTLFVEGLREHNGSLNALHATLLLLGIHEDTGSLTYTSTTPRDVRAAAYLMEQGASLQILSRYLNPPLSDDQRQVYDRLLSTAERHAIHGQSILVARAHAETLTDEISTIAHKLRDLLDPDALLLLVQTGEGIRLVARSITDNVDVSKIAEHFGGGGHGRAAAALIRTSVETISGGKEVKTPTLEEVHNDLLQILPVHVRHSLTVRQIMSPRPLVLTPDTSVERASQLMQRYGYEGYPVVEDGKVRGLLTRRAVDRALSHRLNLPASSLMESGEVTVYPHDPIEQLRRVMIDSGWGQVPVVDPESGKVIGIVTRTDLLKTMTDTVSVPGRQNLAARLESALSPARLALLKTVAAKGYEERTAVYIVGGFVRDLLLNRPSPDFDVVVEGDAIHLASQLSKSFGGRLLTHSRFGTAKWSIGEIRGALADALSDGTVLDPEELPDSLDLISARTEFYDYPTALPTVERSSIKLDLHRRDFTINTMALRLDGRHYGELYDYWGGLRDLHGGLVRVLHSLSFVDDPTRVLRAVRFEQRFSFRIEERTLQLIDEAHSMLRQVSGDRLRHELNLILAEERAPAMLARLQELNLLADIHSDLAWSDEYRPLIERVLYSPIDVIWGLPEKVGNLPLRTALAYLIWLLQLPLDAAIGMTQRLRLTNEILDSITAAYHLIQELPGSVGSRPSQITERLTSVPTMALFAVDLVSPSPEVRQVIASYLASWQNTWPATTGDHLREMGVQPGPQYRRLLKRLRDAWLDGEISSEVEEKQLLHELIDRLPGA